jgi:RNA polymerase sigma-70 factor (ECF subfamily)
VRRHYRAAFAVALAVLGEIADAEDVAHDALVRAGARLSECKQPDRFAAWLVAIARNLAIKARSTRARREAAPLGHATAASADDSARSLADAELRRELLEALAALTPEQREVLLLHDLDGWPHAHIALAIGTSEGMSRQHLFNARRKLRDALGLELWKEYRDG